MTGQLLQINISNGGIPKRCVERPVMVSSDGLEGDRHLNLKYHGGPDKAVLMISAEILADLKHQGFPVFPGALGENLTVSGLDAHQWRSGQRWRVGDVVIELTTLRTPCLNLHVYGVPIKAQLYDARCKAGDVTSPHWAHGGFYARVIRPGLLIPGAAITLESDVA